MTDKTVQRFAQALLLSLALSLAGCGHLQESGGHRATVSGSGAAMGISYPGIDALGAVIGSERVADEKAMEHVRNLPNTARSDETFALDLKIFQTLDPVRGTGDQPEAHGLSSAQASELVRDLDRRKGADILSYSRTVAANGKPVAFRCAVLHPITTLADHHDEDSLGVSEVPEGLVLTAVATRLKNGAVNLYMRPALSAAVDQRLERGREVLVLGFREYTFVETLREGESLLMTGLREPGDDRVVSLLATWRVGDQLAMN